MAAQSESRPAFRMHITPSNTGLWGISQTEEAAKATSDLLQEDLEKHHVFFNQDGFHNHIPHHLLALYGTGAGPSSLHKAYNGNAGYQRPALPPHDSTTPKSGPLDGFESLKPYLGNENYYPDFLRFFQSEISKTSWQDVTTKYLWQDEEMLIRLFAGFLHPLIQLMYGMEWAQEAIVAEALAQTAVHGDNLREFLLGAEQRAGQTAMPAINTLLQQVKDDERVSKAARNEDGNKIRDGILARAKEEMINLVARVKVGTEEIEERTAEMFDAALYMASAAALVKEKEGKVPKFDFFLMHHVNASPIFVTINKQDWIPSATKARLLEWKIRMDLIQYAARGVPDLSVDSLNGYKPRKPDAGQYPGEIITRLHDFPDDGHAIKLGRATVVCRNICKKYEEQGKGWLKVKGDDMWNRVCHLVVDSVEYPGEHWVRSCGFDEAWKNVPNLQDVKL